MKHSWLRGVFVAAVMTATLTVSAGAASPCKGVVNADGLRLRGKANTSSAILSMAYRGEKVDVLEDAGSGWYKVTYCGKTGYMSGEYLKLEGALPTAAQPEEISQPEQAAEPEEAAEPETAQPEEIAEEETPAAAAPDLGSGKVDLESYDVLNFRCGPATGCKKLGVIPGGAVLTLLEEQDGWYKVTYNGREGYVCANYIKRLTQDAAAADQGQPQTQDQSDFGTAIVALAKQYIGTPYAWGGNGPNYFDCSGFTSFLYRQMGVKIPRGGTGQYNAGTPVSRENLRPGDLVFINDPVYSNGYPVSHVGMYIGNGQFIHASSNPGEGVTINNLFTGRYGTYYAGARRFV